MYDEQIQDVLERKVARRISDDELVKYKDPVFYLAHVVVKEDSKSMPCRVVFNSSEKMFGQVINEY